MAKESGNYQPLAVHTFYGFAERIKSHDHMITSTFLQIPLPPCINSTITDRRPPSLGHVLRRPAQKLTYSLFAKPSDGCVKK